MSRTSGLSFNELRRTNLARCVEGFKHPVESWRLSQWTNAMAGECGEACNLTKKIDHLLDALRGNKPDDRSIHTLSEQLADEVADVVIYADLTLARLGVSLGEAVRKKFNEKSIEIGAPHRL